MLDRLSDAVPVGIFQIDIEGHIRFSNAQFHSILGVDAATTIEEQFASAVEPDRERLQQGVASVLADQPVDDSTPRA